MAVAEASFNTSKRSTSAIFKEDKPKSVGYKTQEVQVKGQKQLQVVLSEDAEMLDEVVVIGYGTMKKSDLTGAVSSIGNKDIKDSPVSNLGQAIQGKISGVQIVDAGLGLRPLFTIMSLLNSAYCAAFNKEGTFVAFWKE